MNQDFKEFFASLNARGVEFLVLGGVAYNFYAPPRATKDIDVWIRPTVENANAFLAALTEFGFPHQLDAKELAEQEKVQPNTTRTVLTERGCASGRERHGSLGVLLVLAGLAALTRRRGGRKS